MKPTSGILASLDRCYSCKNKNNTNMYYIFRIIHLILWVHSNWHSGLEFFFHIFRSSYSICVPISPKIYHCAGPRTLPPIDVIMLENHLRQIMILSNVCLCFFSVKAAEEWVTARPSTTPGPPRPARPMPQAASGGGKWGWRGRIQWISGHP